MPYEKMDLGSSLGHGLDGSLVLALVLDLSIRGRLCDNLDARLRYHIGGSIWDGLWSSFRNSLYRGAL